MEPCQKKGREFQVVPTRLPQEPVGGKSKSLCDRSNLPEDGSFYYLSELNLALEESLPAIQVVQNTYAVGGHVHGEVFASSSGL